MAEYDVIIIGGGISGLSMAHYCAGAGYKCLVLEKSERLGGAVHSHDFAEEGADFWLELGPHTCYNSYGGLIGILEAYGLVEQIIAREKVPFKLLIGNDLKSMASRLSFLELLFHAPRLFTLSKEGVSIKSYYGKIVGRGNYDAMFRQLFSGVVSQNADDFPAELLFKKRPRRKDILKKFTFNGGLQTIINAVAAKIDFITGKEVKDIEFQKNIFSVTTTGGTYQAAKLVMAAPAPAAASLLNTSFPAVAEVLKQIGLSKVETMAAAVDKAKTSIAPAAIIVPVDDNFYSIVTRDVVPDEKWRGFTFHFKPELMDEESKLKRISEILHLGQENITYTVAKTNYLPALKVGHDKITGKVDELINSLPLFITGNYWLGLAMEDCVARSAREFKRLQEL